jgi:tetratricopeptide (TPR) repeat protein
VFIFAEGEERARERTRPEESRDQFQLGDTVAITMYNSTNTGGCSSPSVEAADVPPAVLLPKEIQMLREDAIALKELGNAAFYKNEYEAALHFFTKGISLPANSSAVGVNNDSKEVAVGARTGLTEVTHQLLANRAQVYLKLGHLTNAEADCTAIIQENEYHDDSNNNTMTMMMTTIFAAWNYAPQIVIPAQRQRITRFGIAAPLRGNV